ncbi:MAG: fibronectin type III domain-containing protein [Gammaproteobacteria bacterium]
MNIWTFARGVPLGRAPFRETWRLLPDFTTPYIIITAVPADPTLSLAYGFNAGIDNLVPMTAGKGVKIRVPNKTQNPTFEIYVGVVTNPRDYARKIEIGRRGVGIPDDPGLNAPVHAANALALSWSAPTDDGGAAVTAYKARWASAAAPAVYLNAGGASGADVPGGAAARAYVIAGLANNTAYLVEVAAVNAHGLGGWADAQSGTPGTISRPGMPRAPAVVRGSEKLDLTWRAPQHTGGAAISDYKVRWKAAGAGAWSNPAGADGESAGADDTAYGITGLTNGATYEAQVAAENSSGIGAWTASQTARPGTPGAPASVSSSISDATLAVAWAAPANAGSAAISDYKVRWKIAGARAWGNPAGADGESAGAGDTAYDITGLTNGTTYEAQVAAVNSFGGGAWSAPHRNNPATPPHAPGSLSAQPGALSLNLTWTAPADDGGDAVLGYVVRWAEGAGSSAWVRPPGETGRPVESTATATAYTLRGLKGAATYEVQVAARNDAGSDAWTASAQGVTIDFTLDIDANGMVEWQDGVMIARYLAGVRGAALVTGMGDALDAAAVAAEIEAGARGGALDVDASGVTTAADGIMIARYLLGVTSGAALVEGMTSPTKLNAVIQAISDLPSP